MTVTFPAVPTDRPRLRFPWVMVLAPMVLGGVLWSATGGNQAYLLFMLLSPLMYGANAVSDRLSGGRDHRRSRAAYEEAVAAAREEVSAAVDAEVRRRRDDAPDPAALGLTAAGPGARLWERRPHDDDALLLRMGSADLPAALTVRGPDPDTAGRPARRRWRRAVAAPPRDPGDRHPALPAVPVTVPLASVGVLGVAGAGRHGLARWLAGQLAALHPPRDLRIVLLAQAPDGPRDWSWLRWLPHTSPTRDHHAAALVGVGAAQVAARVAELTAVLDRRLAAGAAPEPGGFGSAGASGPAGHRGDGPAYVLLLDDADALRASAGVVRLLTDGPRVGIHAICLAEDALELPAECGATVTLVADATAMVVRAGAAPVAAVVADLVSPRWAERLARCLTPVRDTTPDAVDGRIPPAVRYLDLAGPVAVDPVALAAAWQSRPRSTSTVLGLGADGPVSVDLEADGPHALVAGTTGAGKSELLQTLVAGLALGNRPDELAFILVDYKGGAAFADCAALPHTVGVVTDLDNRLTARALESLAAELRRREHLFAAAGAKDLAAYLAVRTRATDETAALAGDRRARVGPDGGRALHGTARPPEPLPRLVIVVDEFALLVDELPDFVAGLVDIARRGRSLGVHLVLATQRPSGVVSPEIRANTPLRLCLRVTDAGESADVLDAPAAARILPTTPGRGYARLADGGLTAVQTARIGGRPPPPAGPAVGVRAAPWAAAGDPVPGPDARSEDVPTDLATLVTTVATAADLAGIAVPASPWLAPLPLSVTLDDLPGAGPDRVPLGLHDLPSAQRRDVYALDLAHGGHLMVVGGPRSGRSTALRTLGGSLARSFEPRDAHLYALDCGSGGLACLEALPHCGAVVPRDDTGRGVRLIARLLAEIARRHDLLGQAGYGSVAEQRAAAAQADRLPWMVLTVDAYEGFLHAYGEIDGGRVVDDLGRLLHEGPAAGLRVVVTGDRQLLTSRLSALVGERLVLPLADIDTYALAGIPAKEVPERGVPGRALAPGATITDVQLALLDADPAGPRQVAAVSRIGVRGPSDVPAAQRPIRLRPLPTRVSATTLRVRPGGRLYVLLGLGGDAAEPVGFDLAEDGPGALVAGPAGSGRTTALRTAARTLTARGTPVAVVGGRRSGLASLAGVPGVVGLFGAAAGDRLGGTLAAHAGRPLVVLVDDADQLTDTSVDAVLASLLEADEPLWGLVAAGGTDDLAATYRGFTVPLRRSRLGVLLSPARPSDGELLGIRVTRGAASRPGLGLLATRGHTVPIQVAIDGHPSPG